MDDGKLDALGQTIVSALGGAASTHAVAFNQLTVTVEPGRIVDVVKFLRDDPSLRFVNIIDVTAVDYPGREKRFDVVYVTRKAIADENLFVKQFIRDALPIDFSLFYDVARF